MAKTAKARVGAFEVFVLYDGYKVFNNEIYPTVPEERISELLSAAGKTEILTNFSAVLLRSSDRCILIDAGAREHFGPTGGIFPESLAETDVSPDEIQTVFVTHLHPDHVGGMTRIDNSAVFRNAELVVTETEYNFWTDDNRFSGADEMKRAWRQIGLDTLSAYQDRIRTVRAEEDISPGVSVVDIPGHTPGHAGVRVESDGQSYIHTADILHAQDLQLAEPGVSAIFDMDSDKAAKSRKNMLDMIAHDQILFSGSHFLNCFLGHLETRAGGYRLSEA